MSKNVVITESGSGKKFTVKRLRTNTANGDTCDWFPEDELGSKEIVKNGTYRSVDDGLFGYNYISVDIPDPGGHDFTELYAYENGTYRARSENYDGYSKATVDISSISGTEEDGNDYVIDLEPDPETGELTFPVEIDPETGEPVIDPETGNPIIVTKKIPSKIKIDVLPSKLEYRTGETVYLTGGVIKAYDGNDNLFTDATYTDGVIPNSELEVAPLTVSYDAAVEAGGRETQSGDLNYADFKSGKVSRHYSYQNAVDTGYECSGNVRAVLLGNSETFGGQRTSNVVWFISENEFTAEQVTYVDGAETARTSLEVYTETINGRLYYCCKRLYSPYNFHDDLLDENRIPYIGNLTSGDLGKTETGFSYTYGALNGEPSYYAHNGGSILVTEDMAHGWSAVIKTNAPVRMVILKNSGSWVVHMFSTAEFRYGISSSNPDPSYTTDAAPYQGYYHGTASYGMSLAETPIPVKDIDGSTSDAATGLLYTYGSSSVPPTKFGCTQVEEVTWICPYNQKPMKDSYEIVVLKPENSNDNWSQSSGGGHF